jgi:hypothetical protein
VVKIKLSRYRPGQALGVPGGWGSRISRQSAHQGGKVVSPTHWPSLPQEGFLVLISVRGWVDARATMRPEGLSLKNCSDFIGNRTRDLPACIAVPQPNAPPRSPYSNTSVFKLVLVFSYTRYLRTLIRVKLSVISSLCACLGLWRLLWKELRMIRQQDWFASGRLNEHSRFSDYLHRDFCRSWWEYAHGDVTVLCSPQCFGFYIFFFYGDYVSVALFLVQSCFYSLEYFHSLRLFSPIIFHFFTYV